MSFLALFDIMFESETPPDFVTIALMYNILLINLVSGAFVCHMVILSAFCLVIWIALAVIFTEDVFVMLVNISFLIVVIYLNGFTFYNREFHQREIYNVEQVVAIEIKATEDLVMNLLPKHVYAKVHDPEN